MLTLNKVHHIAILCSDYQKSKTFYTEVLGLTIIREIYREERQSYKLDLALNGIYAVELFSFPNPPKRPSRPETVGLRHLAFEVINLDETVALLNSKNIDSEPIRIDGNDRKAIYFYRGPRFITN